MIKKKKKLPQYIYFKRSLTFLFKSQLVVSIAFLIEYFDIYVNSIDMTKQLFSYKSEYTDKGENKIIRSIKYISPYYYIFKLMTKEYSFILRPDEIGAIIYFFLFILFLVLMYTLNDINISKMTILSKNINKVYINFYDYFFFRTFSILFIHCITANIVRYFNKDENDNSPITDNNEQSKNTTKQKTHVINKTVTTLPTARNYSIGKKVTKQKIGKCSINSIYVKLDDILGNAVRTEPNENQKKKIKPKKENKKHFIFNNPKRSKNETNYSNIDKYSKGK